MNKINTIRNISALMITLLATACTHLQDEHYAWCSDNICPVAVVEQAPVIPEEPIVEQTAPKMERLILAADALFHFDRSGIEDMLSAGKAKLNHFGHTILDKGIQAKQMIITGHTDRMGSHAYNQPLSEARAATVAQYLQDMGIQIPMKIEGKASTEPVTTGCKGQREVLIACLTPDRRVTVDLIGIAVKN